jgi:PmbA protein
MMIEKELKKLSKRVDEVEIFCLDAKSATIKTKKLSIDSFKEKQSSGFGIRVIKNKKMGFYFTNSLDSRAADMAVKVSKVAQRDEHISLPSKQVYKNNSSTNVEMNVEEGIRMAEELVSTSSDFKNVKSTTGTISWNTSKTILVNSHDVYGEKTDFTLSTFLGTVAKGSEPSTGFHFEVSRQKDINALEVGKTAFQLAKDSLNAKSLETRKRRIILRPMAVAELLEYTLIPSFSADNIQRGRSKLDGLIGTEVFGGVNIVDDATISDGLMSEKFDDEGVIAQKTNLIDDGVLQGFLYDVYTANKDGRESTGNGTRAGYTTLLGVGPSNFLVNGGSKIAGDEGALIVHGLVGAHTSNPISGDFSVETRNAFIDGVPIKKAIVSGNIFDILNSGVGFGKDTKQYTTVISPSIEIPEIMVVG